MAHQMERFPDVDALAHAAAALFTQAAAAAVAQRGRFTVALSGGSTPRTLHTLLAQEPYRSQIAWEAVHVFWGDERTVPPEHPDSNYRMAAETLLSRVPIPASQVYRMAGEQEPHAAASAYETQMRAVLGTSPRLDLILLGMGDDGHTASLFPQTAALRETVRWVVANEVPQLNTWRITLTYPVLNAADTVVFLVAGAAKRDRLNQVLTGPAQPELLPAQGIQPMPGALRWLVAVD